MVDFHYLAGALAILLLAWLGLSAITGHREGGKTDTSTMLKRAVIGIIASLTTRIMLHDSGLGTSDVTLWSISIGAGFAVALIYKA